MNPWIALPLRTRRPVRRGITLFELILALALSVLLLGAIAMAIRLNLRSLDSRRADVEEAQLARAVLRMITDDLHSAVQHEVVDFSPLESMAQSSAASQAAAAAAASAASSGNNAASGASGGGGGGGGGSTSTTTTKTTTTTTSKGGGGGGGGGSGGGKTTTTTTSKTTTTTTSPSGGSSSGGTSGGSSGASSGSSSGSSSGASTADTSTATEDIASTTTPPPIPGLYGNQYELQIDVSRLPRLDEYQQAMTGAGGGALHDIPSAVKTVAYYLRGQGVAPTNTGFGTPGVLSMQDAQRPGLVRRQLDRAVTLQASQSGSSTSIMQQGDLIAPEVVSIEFRYSDGSQWLTEWDSNQMQGLPVAVEILVGLQPALAYVNPNDINNGNSTFAKQAVNQVPRMYRHVVRLPAGKVPPTTDGTETSTDGTSTGSTGTTSGGGTSSGSTTGASR